MVNAAYGSFILVIYIVTSFWLVTVIVTSRQEDINGVNGLDSNYGVIIIASKGRSPPNHLINISLNTI